MGNLLARFTPAGGMNGGPGGRASWPAFNNTPAPNMRGRAGGGRPARNTSAAGLLGWSQGPGLYTGMESSNSGITDPPGIGPTNPGTGLATGANADTSAAGASAGASAQTGAGPDGGGGIFQEGPAQRRRRSML
jgi:hypothetical protein